MEREAEAKREVEREVAETVAGMEDTADFLVEAEEPLAHLQA